MAFYINRKDKKNLYNSDYTYTGYASITDRTNRFAVDSDVEDKDVLLDSAFFTNTPQLNRTTVSLSMSDSDQIVVKNNSHFIIKRGTATEQAFGYIEWIVPDCTDSTDLSVDHSAFSGTARDKPPTTLTTFARAVDSSQKTDYFTVLVKGRRVRNPAAGYTNFASQPLGYNAGNQQPLSSNNGEPVNWIGITSETTLHRGQTPADGLPANKDLYDADSHHRSAYTFDVTEDGRHWVFFDHTKVCTRVLTLDPDQGWLLTPKVTGPGHTDPLTGGAYKYRYKDSIDYDFWAEDSHWVVNDGPITNNYGYNSWEYAYKLRVSPTGHKVYINSKDSVGETLGTTLREYNAVNGRITGFSGNQVKMKFIDVGNNDSENHVKFFEFKRDGSRLLMSNGYGRSAIYNLSTPWDISTMCAARYADLPTPNFAKNHVNYNKPWKIKPMSLRVGHDGKHIYTNYLMDSAGGFAGFGRGVLKRHAWNTPWEFDMETDFTSDSFNETMQGGMLRSTSSTVDGPVDIALHPTGGIFELHVGGNGSKSTPYYPIITNSGTVDSAGAPYSSYVPQPIVWPGKVKWKDGTAPSYPDSGQGHLIKFIGLDSCSTYFGLLEAENLRGV